MAAATTSEDYQLAPRARQGLYEKSYLLEGIVDMYRDLYDTETNPDGYIIVAWADSPLPADLWRERFYAIDWKDFDVSSMLHYADPAGEEGTRECLAKVINKFFRPTTPVTWDELTLTSGLNNSTSSLASIIFDANDVVLMPAPFYPLFNESYGARSLVEIVGVRSYFNDANGGFHMELSVERFEKAFLDCEASGKRVRAVKIINPQNPVGVCHTIEEIAPIIEWALGRKLYVIADECYNGNNFDVPASRPYTSMTTLFNEKNRNALIWQWGLSKPFSLAGMRCAVVHAPNPEIREALRRYNFDTYPNSITQFVVREMFSSLDWLENKFFPTNLRRLRASRDHCVKELDALGIRYMNKPTNGWSLLLDLSEYLDEQTFEAEVRLYHKLNANRINTLPGHQMQTGKPGYYRFVYTSGDAVTISEAIRRVNKTLVECRAENLKNNNNKHAAEAS